VEEDKANCGTFISLCKKALSDRYRISTGVTIGNINECRMNKLEHCAKEGK
jgi:hypothetical protein